MAEQNTSSTSREQQQQQIPPLRNHLTIRSMGSLDAATVVKTLVEAGEGVSPSLALTVAKYRQQERINLGIDKA